MKLFVGLAIMAAAFLSSNMVQAQNASACSTIRDRDLRSECRAIANHNRQDCSTIRDNDERYLCRARTGGGVQQCSFIRDNDRKAYCRSIAP